MCIRDRLCLADYGCGNGLLGLFAKYCGFKIVLLCDTNADFTQAARALSAAIAVPADAYVHGDIHQLADANIYPVPGIIDVSYTHLFHRNNRQPFARALTRASRAMMGCGKFSRSDANNSITDASTIFSTSG